MSSLWNRLIPTLLPSDRSSAINQEHLRLPLKPTVASTITMSQKNSSSTTTTTTNDSEISESDDEDTGIESDIRLDDGVKTILQRKVSTSRKLEKEVSETSYFILPRCWERTVGAKELDCTSFLTYHFGGFILMWLGESHSPPLAPKVSSDDRWSKRYRRRFCGYKWGRSKCHKASKPLKPRFPSTKNAV